MAAPPSSSAAMGEKYSGIMPKLYNNLADFSKRRNNYVKLSTGERRRRRTRTIRLGGLSKRLPRFRIRRPKLRLSFFSPLNLLRKLRDAYVNMMLSLAARGDLSGAVMGNAMYLPSGMPARKQMDSRKEDEMLAYIDYLRRSGRQVSDPVLER